MGENQRQRVAPCSLLHTGNGGKGFGETNCVRSVQEKFPDHFYLGEETATEKELERLRSGLKDSEWTWIVDPIDGTLNFVSYYMQSCAEYFLQPLAFSFSMSSCDLVKA